MAQAMGVDVENIVFVQLTHSDRVLCVDKGFRKRRTRLERYSGGLRCGNYKRYRHGAACTHGGLRHGAYARSRQAGNSGGAQRLEGDDGGSYRKRGADHEGKVRLRCGEYNGGVRAEHMPGVLSCAR